MDREDGSITALRASLFRPLQHWYRKNRSYIWLYVAIYYGLQIAHFVFYLYLHFSILGGQQAGPGAMSVPLLTAVSIGYSAAYYLLMYVAVLALVKAPAMMVSEPEVELAYSRPEYLRCFISARLHIAYLLVVVLLLPAPLLYAILQLAIRSMSWPVGPLVVTNLLISAAYWLLVAAAAVGLSFLKLSNALENVTAVAAILGNLLLWMISLRLGMLMIASAGLVDQVLVTLFRIGIWGFVFGTLFYFLHKRLIPRLAARYLTN